MSLLSERVEQNDPTLYQAMVQEVSLHFFVLYPFIDDVITSPVEWVELYQKRYDNSFVETTEPSLNCKKMEDWMQRIDQELMDLV